MYVRIKLIPGWIVDGVVDQKEVSFVGRRLDGRKLLLDLGIAPIILFQGSI